MSDRELLIDAEARLNWLLNNADIELRKAEWIKLTPWVSTMTKTPPREHLLAVIDRALGKTDDTV